MSKMLKAYMNSAVLPFAAFVASCLIPFFICNQYLPNANLFLMTFPPALLFFFGMASAAVVNFINRRWGKGLVNLGLVVLVAIIFSLSRSMSIYWR